MRQTEINQSGQTVLMPRQQFPKQQQGVALIVSMILLAVITLLSVTAMRGTNLDARIAANHQHKQISFQAAANAFAKLTSDNPEVEVPTAYSGTLNYPDYVFFAGIEGQPESSGDLDLAFVRQSSKGEFKFSGYSLNATALIYTADTYGSVSNSKARSHHRATVVLVRD